jgi:hypothetical protein
MGNIKIPVNDNNPESFLSPKIKNKMLRHTATTIKHPITAFTDFFLFAFTIPTHMQIIATNQKSQKNILHTPKYYLFKFKT